MQVFRRNAADIRSTEVAGVDMAAGAGAGGDWGASS